MMAQVDVSSAYLQNNGFDANFNYGTSASGNVAQEIDDISGWTKDISVNYTIAATFAYGTGATFNNSSSLPASGYKGSTGGALALSTGWGSTLKYYQTITLPAGSYGLAAAYYNAGSVTSGSSLLGWIPASGTSTLSSVSSFTRTTWVADTIKFEITSATTGNLQIGLSSISGSGSGSTAKILVDYVKLLRYFDKDDLDSTLTVANSVYSSTGTNASTLYAAIVAGQNVSNKSTSTTADYSSATYNLQTALFQYRLDNASQNNPLDFTSYISNPSFESSFTGWVNNGFATQTNSSFANKSGSIYVEKWVSSGSKVPNVSVAQTVSLPSAGLYKLTVAAANIQQSSTGTTQTGASIFATDSTLTVNSANDYSLSFYLFNDTTTLGFQTKSATGNWVMCDNFRLYFMGCDIDAMASYIGTRATAVNYYLNDKMQASARTLVTSAVAQARAAATASTLDMEALNSANLALMAAGRTVSTSIAAYKALQAVITAATTLYGDGSGNDASTFLAAIQTAQTVNSDLTVTLDEINQAAETLTKAMLAYHIANGSGTVPTVVTNPFFARGSASILGRITVSGVTTSQIQEQGLCWSTSHNPTVLDSRTTQYLSHNGNIYLIEDLQPSTIYYVRGYCITTDYQVGYGDEAKVITIPRGSITYGIRSISDANASARITAAISSAVSYWNSYTSMSGLYVNAGYSSGVPTAEGSYGGYITFGSSSSYQQIGTAMHEMDHTVGVGQHTMWYGPTSPLRETGVKGLWLGTRANNLVQFLENSTAVHLTGDATHMWATGGSSLINYGINGSSEDDGSKLLYISNSLVTQAIGEDGLPPTGGFATPAYTFEQEDNVKYYIKNEDRKHGLYTAFLQENSAGNLVWATLTAAQALQNDKAAWYVIFNPATGYYRIKNVSTGKYFTYSATGTNGIGLTTTASPGSNESFQLMGSRSSTTLTGLDESLTTTGYWVVHPAAQLNPPAFAATDGGTTAASTFNFTDGAASQRWLFLTAAQASTFDNFAGSIILTDLAVNGTTVDEFSCNVQNYTYAVASDANISNYTVTAASSSSYDGTLSIVQATSIPGTATVTATGADGVVDAVYTLHYVVNHISRWDGDGATGTGSQPSTFGWASAPTVTWGVANGSSSRYMDATGYSGYTYQCEDYDQNRILWIRYNSSENFTYSFSGLTASNSYCFNFKYGWHNNGTVPTLTVGIYEASDSTLISSATFKASTTKCELKEGSILFTLPSDAGSSLYLSFKSNVNSDCMVALGDLEVVDYSTYSAGQGYLSTTVDGNTLYLSRGLNWGTRAVADEYGVLLTRTAPDTNGNSTLMFADNSGYLFQNSTGVIYTDNSTNNAWCFTLAGGSDDEYYIKAANGLEGTSGYLTVTADSALTSTVSIVPNASKWKWVTKSTHDSDVAAFAAAQKTAAMTAAGFASGANPLTYTQSVDAALSTAAELWNVRMGDSEAPYKYPLKSYTGLNPGLYKVSLQAFHRNAAKGATSSLYVAGNEDQLATLYAGSAKIQLKSICSDASSTQLSSSDYSYTNVSGSTVYVPDNLSGAGTYFTAGYYENDLYVYVGQEGTLNVGISSPSYIYDHWLAYKNLTLTRCLTAAIDYTALATAITRAQGKTLGFDAGEYAPYNNVDAIKALATAVSLNTARNAASQTVVDNAASAIADGMWSVNTTEVNGFYDGTFATYSSAGASGYVEPKGWAHAGDSTCVLGVLSTESALAHVTGNRALRMSYGTSYGEKSGYTLPLNASTVYKLTFEYSGWDSTPLTDVTVTDGTGTARTLCPVSQFTPAGLVSQDATRVYTATLLFKTGDAGNYKVAFDEEGTAPQQIIVANLSLLATSLVDLTWNETTGLSGEVYARANVSLTRTLKENYFNTVVLPFDLSASEVLAAFGENAQTYEVTGKEGEDVVLTLTSGTRANVPFFLRNVTVASGNLYTFNDKIVATSTPAVTVGAVTLTGTYSPISAVPEGNYIINNGKYYLIDAGATATLKAFRAYLSLAGGGSSIIGLRIDDTAVDTPLIEIEGGKAQVYDLYGRRVLAPVKGLYIVNGKKVIIK